MKKLLKYILDGIGITDYSIEKTSEDENIKYSIHTLPENIGILIGKNGKTIKAIQDILRVKGQLSNKSVYIDVAEKK